MNRPYVIVMLIMVLGMSLVLGGCGRNTDATAAPPTLAPTSVSPVAQPTEQAEGETQAPEGFFPTVKGWVEEFGVFRFFLLVALSGLFVIAAAILAYLLIRRRSPAPRVSSTGTGTGQLSSSATLNGGRYVILGPAREAAAGSGVTYEVRTAVPFPMCPACYSALPSNGALLSLCPRCGAGLDTTTSGQTVLTVREIDAARYEIASELLARQLSHDAIVTLVDAFMEPEGDTIRYYQVEPQVRDSTTPTAPMYQPLSVVLGSGVSLAEGLDYLHQRQVVLQKPDASVEAHADDMKVAADEVQRQMLLGTDAARWLCFKGARPLTETEEQTVAQIFHRDVQGLAAALLKLTAGSADPGALTRLPEPVRAVFARALAQGESMSAADFAVALAEQRRELAFQGRVHLKIGARTDVGRVRKLNEDNLFVRDFSDLFAPVGITVAVAAVADGVGGHEAGDVASRLAVEALSKFGETLRRTATNKHMPDPEPWVVRSAQAANLAVFEAREASSSDMGCTLVMALFVGSAATLLNVGDSRAYHLRPQGIKQVTIDHSLVQRLIEIGQLTREEARHHPQKSIIYRVIGDTQELAYDVFEMILQPGEALLFCSDGLSDMVEDPVLWQVWRAASSLDAACEQLIALANEAGGHDNITVVIVQMSED